MRKWLKSDFNFSKREFNGLLVLIVLLGLITVMPTIYEMFIPEQEDLPAERAAILQLQQIEAEKKYGYNYGKDAKGHKQQKLFKFDPNTASLSDWQLLGLSPKQAAVMLRYREKGGRFRHKEELKKMYPISANLYGQLESYIHINSITSLEIKQHYPKPAVKLIRIDLNRADTTALDSVKGIGPAFARRIFNYRQRLGGFYKKEQLLEVYGVDSSKYEEVKGQLILESGPLKQIKINSVGFEELRHHPYLNYKQVNAILQFRKQHGNYGNIADLKKVAILSAATLDKLTPYISFDHD
jgi:competence protein ComEA